MVFSFNDLEGGQAAEINQAVKQVTGYGFVEGGRPTEGARPFAVDFLDAVTYINGEKVATEATSIDLIEEGEHGDLEKPRKIIIYIGADGEFHVDAGAPATPKPRGRLRFQTFEPSPPDFRDREGVPVAEVWIGAYSQHVTDEDIRDRRLNSRLETHTLSAGTVDFNTLIDGSGTSHSGIVSGENRYDIDDVRTVINEDAAHATDASHEYFSGLHNDLFAIAFEDHHERYTEDEALSAVAGNVDLAELTADETATPGYHLEIGEDGLTWDMPPIAQAPVLKSGTITHAGGSSTSATISDITPSQTSEFEVVTAVGVDTAPSWSADYAYSTASSYRWDDAGKNIQVDLNVTWDTDPGSGNDLTLRYYVYEMSPDVVNSLYNDGLAAKALTGEDLSLTSLDVGEKFNAPVYDAPGDVASPSIGDVILSTDPESGEFGEFVHDGSGWTGPYAEGVTSLADLLIDGGKDWGGYAIQNVGSPIAASDVIRVEDINTHEALSGSHHAKTTSGDIDHSGMANVVPDQHHAPYTDDEAVDAIVERDMTRTIGASTIPDGESARVHAALDDDEILHLEHVEHMVESGGTLSGVALQIVDFETGDVLYIQNDQYKASSGEPLVSIEGPRGLDIRVRNQSGDVINAGGTVSYRLERGVN